MAEKLTIIVTCASRKALPPLPGLRVRDLGGSTLAVRFDDWAGRLSRIQGSTTSLRALYRGDAWTSALRLEGVARAAGYAPEFFVASAGLGLRPVGIEAPSYASTFTPKHPDSCAANVDEARAWWRALSSLPGSLPLTDIDSPRMLLVLSKAYAGAMHDDIVALVRRRTETEILLFGGAEAVEGVHRIPADRGLRPRLGGTATSLNVRAAEAWLARDDGREFWSTALEQRWMSWATRVRRSEIRDRARIDDAAVIEMIRELRRRNPALSHTQALREVRGSGFACEYTRFRALFESVTA